MSRARRAEIQREAHTLRLRGQRAGWSVERIAGAIVEELQPVRFLEAWRLAYGWSRRQAIEGMAALYAEDGLAAPAVNSSMLCRWEHGSVAVSAEYVDVLARLYGAFPDQLGLAAPAGTIARPAASRWYGRVERTPSASIGVGMTMTASSDNSAALAALRQSIELALEAEGPAGGQLTLVQLDAATSYYAERYSRFAPALLATEVHRCRALVTGALAERPSSQLRVELRRVGGWLSALLGNLAFHLADYAAAHIHLGTAARLGTDVGDARLVGWSLGAQSMVARYQRRHIEALDLAHQALDHADSPLRHAQLHAWAELPALAHLGRGDRADAAMAAARRNLDADPHGGEPGRFGFDAAEMELHVAEAHLVLGRPAPAADHASASIAHTRRGRPGWAAATVTLAIAEVGRGLPGQAAVLAHGVLDTVDPQSLRETTRQRLRRLDADLAQLARPGPEARDLRDRLRSLPAPSAPFDSSDEPNGEG